MHNVQFCPGCLRDTEFENGVCAKCGFDMNGYTVMPHHLVPGTLVKQRYKIGRVLGEGGFGITYIGIDTVLNLKVAIKEFYMSGYVNRNHDASPNVFATLGTHRDTFEKNREKFLNEARVLAQFYGEAGIVGVRDFCEENGTAYIIMDFLNGVDLKTYLEQKGRLAPEEAGIRLYPGAAGSADEAVHAFLAGTLQYQPDLVCSHHRDAPPRVCGSHTCSAACYHERQEKACHEPN